MINFFQGDCMEYMRQKPDKYYDLAVVDPPYGGGKNHASQCHGYKAKNADKPKYSDSKMSEWNVAPDKSYFDELFRVSQNQVIWGGNYFDLPPTRCFLVWHKLGFTETWQMAMAEFAWTSYDRNAKLFSCVPQGNCNEKRFHPTQKPVKLYTWIFGLFAKTGMKVLDTHGGSMSSAIAAYRCGLDMDICELDETFFRLGKERVEKEMRQEQFGFVTTPVHNEQASFDFI